MKAQAGQQAQLNAQGHSQEQQAASRRKSLGMRQNGKGLFHHHKDGESPHP